jgi:hypothetical protein
LAKLDEMLISAAKFTTCQAAKHLKRLPMFETTEQEEEKS